ncbi:hypothetical protein AB3K25_10050 [Leuconostoc sp. MS02]|uniref:Uncharacterized protein n=1 Tax=Leuconostoc aquikimchii TaxID=3236804 RepID=A0ABV3S075_9LACO
MMVEVAGKDPKAAKQPGEIDSAVVFDIYMNNSPLAFAAMAKWTAEDEAKFKASLDSTLKVTAIAGVVALVAVGAVAILPVTAAIARKGVVSILEKSLGMLSAA